MTALPEVIELSEGATVVGAGESLLSELLVVLDQELALRGVSDGLKPSGPKEFVRDRCRSVGLEPPAELLALYNWHNGVDYARPVLPRFPLAPIEDAVRHYAMVLSTFADSVEEPMAPDGPTSDVDWGAPPGWLRLFLDSYTIAVECDSAIRPPRVRATTENFWQLRGPARQVVSLCTPIVWMIEGIRAGAHVWDRDRVEWKLDPDALPELQRKYGFV